MRLDEALALLGLDRRPDDATLRTAYLAAVRRVHPDVTAGHDANHRTAQVNLAYAIAVAASPTLESAAGSSPAGASWEGAAPTATGPTPPASALRTRVTKTASDTLVVSVSPGELAMLLIEVGNDIGDFSFFDRVSGLMQLIVEFVGEPVSYLLLAIQATHGGTHTTLVASIESIEDRPPAPIGSVTELLADLLEDAIHRARI
jgi:hypothetical protein